MNSYGGFLLVKARGRRSEVRGFRDQLGTLSGLSGRSLLRSLEPKCPEVREVEKLNNEQGLTILDL